MERLKLWGALAISVCGLVGCGDGLPRRVPIAGKVLIDGQPLARGFIQVVAENDRPASGEIGVDGSFRLTTYEDNDGCVLGKHKVVVIANENQGPYAMKWLAPKEYSNPATTDLVLDVTGSQDDVVIELTWKGGRPYVEEFENEGGSPGAGK
ncbi:MAG: hypothetical protein ACKO38_12155 [Planctomycetota bacterium]